MKHIIFSMNALFFSINAGKMNMAVIVKYKRTSRRTLRLVVVYCDTNSFYFEQQIFPQTFCTHCNSLFRWHGLAKRNTNACF